MNLIERREFPCPTCGAEIHELCISTATGKRMALYVHPDRGWHEGRLDNLLKLRTWLMAYGDIFKETA